MYNQYRDGWLEVICGCMFSGKTEELIRRVKVLSYGKKKAVVFKYHKEEQEETKLISHNGTNIPCIGIKNPKNIFNYIDNVDVVAIDNIQYFHEDIIQVIDYLVNKGIRVIVAGLDQNEYGESYSTVGILLTQAEVVSKLNAICIKCGALASKTQMIVEDNHKRYEPRCRHCFKK